MSLDYTKHDIIIILDAMRWDIGSKAITESMLVGELSKVNTGVTCTKDWYKKYSPVIKSRHVISENPVPLWLKITGQFASFAKAFGKNWLDINPTDTLQKFGQTPALIHLLPPHAPFVYGKGTERCKAATGNIYRVLQDWGQQGNFKLLRQYYREQIDGVLATIYDNLHLFEGYSVLITSDHGEIIGDFDRQYDHPCNVNPDSKKWQILTDVPYFEVDVETSLLNKRMAMLGYL